jgi:hypothetical protein
MPLAIATHSQIALTWFQGLASDRSLHTSLLKEDVRDHFGGSFGGETSANLMMKEAALAPKNPDR